MYKGSRCHRETERAPRKHRWPSVGQHETALQGGSRGINTPTLTSVLACPDSALHRPDPAGRPRGVKSPFQAKSPTRSLKPNVPGQRAGRRVGRGSKRKNHKIFRQSQMHSTHIGRFHYLDRQGHEWTCHSQCGQVMVRKHTNPQSSRFRMG